MAPPEPLWALPLVDQLWASASARTIRPRRIRRRLRTGVGLVMAATIALATGAEAQTSSSFELEWTAPPECPSASEIRASVARLVRRTPELSEGGLEVQATASQQETGLWRCVVRTRFGTTKGQRIIEVESCRAAAESTALIIALMLDPEVGSRNDSLGERGDAPEGGSELNSVEASAASADTEPVDAEDSKTETRPSKFGLVRGLGGVLFAVDVGSLPAPSYGVGARVGILRKSSSLEMGIVDWKAQRGRVVGLSPAAGGKIGLFSGFVAACPAWAVGRVDLGACVLAELGHMKGEGFGVATPYTAGSRWVAGGGGVLVRARLSKLARLSLRNDTLLSLDRPTFLIRGVPGGGEVHRPELVVVRALVALDLTL